MNWRIAEGYGGLMAVLAAGLDITFDCPAHVIDHSGPLVRIETPHSDLRARVVIVTAPTDVLCADTLRFRPALPDKIEAAAVLPSAYTRGWPAISIASLWAGSRATCRCSFRLDLN